MSIVTESASPLRIDHVPGLDGLRGLAVAGVVAFHLDHLRGGYLGVDLFFVLSGFLITSLLLVENSRTQGISITGFWGRRARRLLPAMICVVAAVGIYGATIARADELARLRREGLGALVYASNWVQLGSGDNYFDQFARPSLLRHFWSLAIEEQFYVLWPLVVVAVVSRTRQPARLTGVVCTLGAALSFGWAMWLYDPGESTLRLYYGTDTRVGAIFAGAAVACVVDRWRARLPDDQSPRLDRRTTSVAVLSLGVLAVGWALLPGTSPVLWQGGLAGMSIAAALLVGIVGTGVTSPLTRALSVGPLLWLGGISYGLYLWHWPVIVVLDETRTGLSGFGLDAAQVAVSIALAVASARFIERPVRFGHMPRPVLARAGAVAMLASALILTWGTRPVEEVAGTTLVGADDLGVAETDTPSTTAPRQVVPIGSVEPEPLRLVVVGDSVGQNFGQAAENMGDRFGFVARDSSVAGCPLVSEPVGLRWSDGRVITTNDQCSDWALRWPLNIADTEANTVLMVFGAALQPETEVSPGVWASPCDPAYDRFWRENLDAALDVLVDQNVEVGLATVPYYRGYKTEDRLDEEADCINRGIRAAARGRERVSIVDLAEWVCPDAVCLQEIEGVELRPDGLHYDDATAEVALNWALTDLLGPWADRVALPTSPTRATSTTSVPARGSVTPTTERGR